MAEKNQKDVIIIGSGIGGLTCAIILLKLGFNVTVVEKNNEPGGLMRSYKRFGIECPVGVHYLGSMDEGQPLRRIFDYLGITSKLSLERMGADGPIDQYIFDDFIFNLPTGIDAYEESLLSAFPNDSKQITTIMEGMRKVAGMMQSLSFPFSNSDNFSIVEFLRPMGEMLSQLKCSPGLRSVLEVPCSWIGVPLNECPIFYHHTVLISYLFSSWRLISSGADMADVFIARIKELGGSIILGDDVKKINSENRVANGVQLKSHRVLKAEILIAAIHPKIMLKILQEGAVKPSYTKRINQIEDTSGIFSVHLGLNASVHKELPYNIFKLDTEADGTLAKIVFYQLRKSEKADMNLLTIIAPSNFEYWRKWENTFSGRRGDDYIQKKETHMEELIKNAASILGQLKGVKKLDSYTPLSIRDWVNSPNGSAYGVLRSRSQLLKTASLNRTSVKGLYLAGQSVLAPGILGTALGSLSTVRAIVGAEEFGDRVLMDPH